DAGLFAEEEEDSTMANFEHFFKPIVDVGLLFFGLVNAGVVLNATSFGGGPTWIIFLALLVGRTLGIFLFGFVASRFGLKLPDGMSFKDLFVMGCVAGIGFTVALFVTGVVLQNDPTLRGTPVGDMLKLGALLSFASGAVAMLLGRVLGLTKIEPAPG